jgi:plasmid stabilization system protein ParE
LAKVVWTAEAERWLLKIHDYIALDSPINAFNVAQSIYERAQILEDPEREVHIVGVFHGAMRLDNYLK